MLNIKRKGRICKTDFLLVIQTGMPLSSKAFFKSPSKKLMTITEYPNSLNMQARFKRALGAPVFVNSWENKRIFYLIKMCIIPAIKSSNGIYTASLCNFFSHAYPEIFKLNFLKIVYF